MQAFFNLFILTGFKDELLVNLNYLRGLKGEEKIDQSIKTNLEEINRIEDNKEYFENLSNFINEQDLFNLIIIHEQRHFFNLTEEQKENIKDSLKSLSSIENPGKEELRDVDSIAIFGATYKTQKERLKDGFNYYMNLKNQKPNKIYLLTCFRQIYISELEQLGIISKENLDKIKESYKNKNNKEINNLDIKQLINFIEENQEFQGMFKKDKMQSI